LAKWKYAAFVNYNLSLKILIVKLGSIGDVVHTLPALAAIRAALPNAEIGWAVDERSAEILRGNRLIDYLIEIDTSFLRDGKNLGKILPELRKQALDLRKLSFDIALDFQGLFKSAMIAKLSGAKIRYGFSKEALREPASRFLMNGTVEIQPQTHIVRKNLLLAAKALEIQIPDNSLVFPIFTNNGQKMEAGRIIEQAGRGFAILNPAGGWVTKLWDAEKYGHLADRLWEQRGLISIITTGPGEESLAKKVLDSCRTGKAFAVQPSLKGFFELAKHTKVYIGGDTGPTHLAIAAGAPVVGVFGPTEWWRNGSTNPGDICVERIDIDCRADCHRRTCSNWICMDIGVETVFNAVQRRLE